MRRAVPYAQHRCAALESGAQLQLPELWFDPGIEIRRFMVVPEVASSADLQLRLLGGNAPQGPWQGLHLVCHACFAAMHCSYVKQCAHVQLPPAGQHIAPFAIVSGATFDLTMRSP